MRELTTTPIDSITFEDVVAFCARQIREHTRLEYKQEFSSKGRGRQVAKIVAAFANTNGGMIIYGVEESDARVPVADPSGMDLRSDPRDAVIAVCTHEVFPPVTPEVSEYLPNPSDTSKGFLVIRVPASDQIHAINAGTGIYIRQDDKSEPVRASRDMIEHLSMRERSATDRQDQRRVKAIEQLTLAVGSEADRGALWITIGPRFAPEPLFKLPELHEKVPSLCPYSRFFGRRSPVDPGERLFGAVDGLYSCRRTGKLAGLIDVFGNITLFANLLSPYKIDATAMHDEDVPATMPRDGDRPVSIRADLVAERLFAAFRAIGSVCADRGFVGLVRGKIQLNGTRGIPLIVNADDPFGAHVLGLSRVNDSLVFDLAMSTSDIADDDATLRAMSPVVERLLWAWGCLSEKAPQQVLKGAEMAHLGSGC